MIERCQTRFVYLHGFASGPKSAKAKYISQRLRDLHAHVEVPDLNQPSFERMTITSQLKIIEETIRRFEPTCKVVLIGSSMGGLLATLKARELQMLQALVLLAPGFGLPRRWNELLGEGGLESWRQQGAVDVFHYALNSSAKLDFAFIEDAQRYATEGLVVDVPALVFHGKHDRTVPVVESVRFAQENFPKVTLELLEDDHQLVESLPQIWLTTEKFLKRFNLIGSGER